MTWAEKSTDKPVAPSWLRWEVKVIGRVFEEVYVLLGVISSQQGRRSVYAGSECSGSCCGRSDRQEPSVSGTGLRFTSSAADRPKKEVDGNSA